MLGNSADSDTCMHGCTLEVIKIIEASQSDNDAIGSNIFAIILVNCIIMSINQFENHRIRIFADFKIVDLQNHETCRNSACIMDYFMGVFF